MESPDPEFVRHGLPLIFDVPARMAAEQEDYMLDMLNLLTTRLVEIVGEDKRLQGILRRTGIEWGWGEATWEQMG